MTPEESLHRTVVALLWLYEARGLLTFCHPANGGKRTRAEAGVFKALGVRAGVPDLLLFLPNGRGLQLELKSARGVLSVAQDAWGLKMHAFGHTVVVCRSAEDVEEALSAAGVPSVRADQRKTA